MTRIQKTLATSAALGLVLAPVTSQAGLFDGAMAKMMTGGNHGGGPTYFKDQERFKGVSQVVIGQFAVVFLTKKVDYKKAGFASLDDGSKGIGQFDGPTADDYTKIADAVYADFKTKLAASGVTIADPAAFYASKYYLKLKSEEQGQGVTIPLPTDDKASGIVYWPTALAGHHDNLSMQTGFMNMNMANNFTAQYVYAREAKMPVLNVTYVVDFAEPLETMGKGTLLHGDLKATAQLSISNHGSMYEIVDTNGKRAQLFLNQPQAEAGNFAEVKDITSGFTKTVASAQMVGNLLGAFKGKSNVLGKQRTENRFQFTVKDTANYAALVTSAAGKTSDLMLTELKAAR